MSKLLWQPNRDSATNTNMYRFMQAVNDTFSLNLNEYSDLWKWSTENISDFWGFLWDFLDIKHSKPYDAVIDDPQKMPGAKWFTGAKLNFAENLLRYRDDETAIIYTAEGKETGSLSYKELYNETAKTAVSLRAMGVKRGDRIVGYMPNIPETVICMLAASSIGAMWSSCSPDFGIKGVLDRFGQIKPKVLITSDGYSFKGKPFDSLEKVREILRSIPTVEKVVVVPFVSKSPDIEGIDHAVLFDEFKSKKEHPEIVFEQLPFDHPLYIMYSSGTTGLPKCMVQSAGGILLHQMKEHVLHTDMKREDNMFYFTTCGWMMWNWLVCALSTGATITLFDGNPFHPDPGVLWKTAEKEKISVFGTSAGYIGALKASGLVPKKEYDLKSLRALLSTGSPLSFEGFEFVYDSIKKDLQLASIAGGTDLNGCFALGNPMAPVYSGELQCRGLGMDVDAYDEYGNSVSGVQGELVCKKPFPSMPIYFWDDPDGKKYHAAYFNVFPGVWRHGDYIIITERGGVVMYGRSDATLNAGGVRIGTAEIYRLMEQMEEIEDSLVVGQDWKNDVRVILFVKMHQEHQFTEGLKKKIITTLRNNASPRHVPALILPVSDIPYTLNMKKVELAVKKIIHGKPVLNKDALRNPESLELYKNIPELFK